jgi:crossover junction endodeoxyribonuclease RuvC
MKILGIDPGLASAGWGMLETQNGKLKYLAHGCIETAPEDSTPTRLLFIHNELSKVIEAWRPDAAAMETLYFGRNAKSAIPVAEARGVLIVTLAAAGIVLYEYSPNVLKQSVVGVMRSDKKQVQDMVRLILSLETIPKPDHAADALAAAITCSRYVQEQTP